MNISNVNSNSIVVNNSKTPLSLVGTTPQLYGRGNLRVCRRPGNILLAALNRPAVRNAFDDDMYLDLIDLLHETAAHHDDDDDDDNSIAAIVLTGTGSYFCSGADLNNFQENNESFQQQEQEEPRNTLNKPAGRFMMALIAYPKMICAAVQGPAVGIGVTLLLHCDLVHVSPAATFWIPFTRLALVPELCSSVLLRESMGLSKANELLLLGRKIDAPTAYDWNLCSRIVADNVTNANDNNSNLDNPFDPNSLASRMAAEIQQRLLSLPLSGQTVKYFCHLIKSSGDGNDDDDDDDDGHKCRNHHRREFLQRICRNELLKLDERFHAGHVQMAARQLNIGKSSHNDDAHRRRRLQSQQQHSPKSKL